ncbi:MAG: T9SS type A sorting domain-containing protein [Bacteroidetes bacterium]|nr:T9SS type A sorting domain-containing protein [Bacteroidota bacterium]
MKKIAVLLVLTVISISISAQTNVSGGIFANTTWTLANSPYIVTGNVVLFPTYVLTIQPGVVVKFDAGTQLEIRQASLIALGTSTDSITFTSNGSVVASAWSEVYLNGGTMNCEFTYCNFHYGNNALNDQRATSGDSLIIRNCIFSNNNTGFIGTGTGWNCGIIEYSSFTNNSTGAADVYGTTMNYCDMSYNSNAGFSAHSLNILNHCTFNHNGTGLGDTRNTTLNYCTVNNNFTGIAAGNGVACNYCTIDSNSVTGIDLGKTSQIHNCVIDYNGVGIYDHQNGFNPSDIRYNAINGNNIGIHLTLIMDSIACNHICDNTTYDLQYTGGNNVNLKNNFWCVPDSASLQPLIYDAHDNVSYGIVNYMPMDDGTCATVTGVIENNSANFSFRIFPNPALNEFVVELPANISFANIRIYNSIGEICFAAQTANTTNHIDVTDLSAGLYFVEVRSGNSVAREKLVKE